MKTLSILFLMSCIHQNTKGVASWFESSNSLCIDAYVINVISAGCESVSAQRIGEELTVLKCTKSTIAKDWTKNTFYVAKAGTDLDKDFLMPICSDANSSLYVVAK